MLSFNHFFMAAIIMADTKLQRATNYAFWAHAFYFFPRPEKSDICEMFLTTKTCDLLSLIGKPIKYRKLFLMNFLEVNIQWSKSHITFCVQKRNMQKIIINDNLISTKK